LRKTNNLFFSYDSLTIYDGGSSTSSMMGKYCGYSIPPSHVSSSNEVLIHFHSDQYTVEAGFKMEYNPTGNTANENNTEYYGDYYTEFQEDSSFLEDFFSYRID
jgi:hypothetical protein